MERLWRQWRPAGESLLSLGELSTRERQIALLLIEGGCAKSISRQLSISPGTVRNHVSSVLGKLSVATRQQATVVARERGWI